MSGLASPLGRRRAKKRNREGVVRGDAHVDAARARCNMELDKQFLPEAKRARTVEVLGMVRRRYMGYVQAVSALCDAGKAVVGACSVSSDVAAAAAAVESGGVDNGAVESGGVDNGAVESGGVDNGASKSKHGEWAQQLALISTRLLQFIASVTGSTPNSLEALNVMLDTAGVPQLPPALMASGDAIMAMITSDKDRGSSMLDAVAGLRANAGPQGGKAAKRPAHRKQPTAKTDKFKHSSRGKRARRARGAPRDQRRMAPQRHHGKQQWHYHKRTRRHSRGRRGRGRRSKNQFSAALTAMRTDGPDDAVLDNTVSVSVSAVPKPTGS